MLSLFVLCGLFNYENYISHPVPTLNLDDSPKEPVKQQEAQTAMEAVQPPRKGAYCLFNIEYFVFAQYTHKKNVHIWRHIGRRKNYDMFWNLDMFLQPIIKERSNWNVN